MKRNNPGCCPCPGATSPTCNPCPLPKSTLTLTWNHTFSSDYTCPTVSSQVITTPLLYVGNVNSAVGFLTDVWRTTCFNLRLTTVTYTDGSGAHCYEWARWELVCKVSSFVANSGISLILARSEAACNAMTPGQVAVFITALPDGGAVCSPLHISFNSGLAVLTP